MKKTVHVIYKIMYQTQQKKENFDILKSSHMTIKEHNCRPYLSSAYRICNKQQGKFFKW